jgi:hypothetical protein
MLFLGDVACNVPSQVFGFRSVAEKFNVVVRSQTLKDRRAPVVQVSVDFGRTLGLGVAFCVGLS